MKHFYFSIELETVKGRNITIIPPAGFGPRSVCMLYRGVEHLKLRWSNTELDRSEASHLKSVLSYDRQLFGPLAEAFLSQQEGTDATVSGRGHGALL